MPQKLFVNIGDLGPLPEMILTDQQGLVVNLAGRSVVFRMQEYYSGFVKIDDEPAVIVGNPVNGQVRYQWKAADTQPNTDETTLYKAWFIVERSNILSMNQQTLEIRARAGTFTLSAIVNSTLQTTPELPWNILIDDLLLALAGLSFVGSVDNLAITGSPGSKYQINFVDALAQEKVSLLRINTSKLDGTANVYRSSAYQDVGQMSFPNGDCIYILVQDPADQG